MVRKSDRNKAQSVAEPAAPVDKTRRATRHSRRRKKSSSGSEPEPADLPVNNEKEEVGEISEKSKSEGAEQSTERTSRRSGRRQTSAVVVPSKPQSSQLNSEWQEDPNFWKTEAPAPDSSSESKVPIDEGTTWKIESSNGSGGEIQKLKICRQRVVDSNESSCSPSKDSSSPKRKRSRSKSGKSDDTADENTAEPCNDLSHIQLPDEVVSVVSAAGPVAAEPSSSQLTETADDKEEKMAAGEKVEEQEAEPEPSDPSTVDDATEVANAVEAISNVEEVIANVNEKDVEEKIPSRRSSQEDKPPAAESIPERKDKESTPESNEELNSRPPGSEPLTKESEETPEPEESNRLVEPAEEIKEETVITDTKDPEEAEKVSVSEKKAGEEEKQVVENEVSGEEKEKMVEKETKSVKAETTSRVRTKSETSEEGKTGGSGGERRVLNVSKVKLPVSSEQAMEQIAKKLNERAARFSKENNELLRDRQQEMAATRRRSGELGVGTPHQRERDEESGGGQRSPREEGELTPTPEQSRRARHPPIVINTKTTLTPTSASTINTPRENNASQPLRLKRTTDETPVVERKRRIVTKVRTSKADDNIINISSQSLKLIIPEVKPMEDDESHLLNFEENDIENKTPELVEPPPLKKKLELKPKDMEVRVHNDMREVIKKTPIVIEARRAILETARALGPKLPLPHDNNNKVVRKISVVSGGGDVAEKRTRPMVGGGRSLSPGGGKAPTEVLFITNLVRPFTVPQLKELLARTGTIASNGFYIDKIKSKCYVKYVDVEMAVETRHALNGVRWPVNNPKTLRVEFATSEDMGIVQRLAEDEGSVKRTMTEAEHPSPAAGWLSEQAAIRTSRRVTTAVREWDMGKVGAVEEEKRPPEEWKTSGGAGAVGAGKADKLEVGAGGKRRAASPPAALKQEPPQRKVRKKDNDAPARLLDDLFRKTKTTPCIYWLPLTAEQIAVKEEIRRQHMAEHERRLAELKKSDHSRRDKERDKDRERRKK